jgi:hypothetical protein
MRKWPPPSKNIEEFFAAMEIPNGRNRAIICTAKAHAMSMVELNETIERLECDREERVEQLRAWNYPEVNLALVAKNHNKEAIKLLQRVKKQRSE